MVCPRCIEAVEDILKALQLEYIHIELGKVSFKKVLTEQELSLFGTKLNEKGFEIIFSKEERIVNQIKTVIIDKIHYKGINKDYRMNFSTYLEEKLNIKYSKLSKIFSTLESRTIEKFIILQKIEKVKELLEYGELSLSEISYKLDYSSPQHLSKQFKQISGKTPSEYKNHLKRKFLDDL